MAGYRFGLLGTVECWNRDGAALTLSRYQRTALALLLVDMGRPVSADRLIEALWGDSLPADPRAALRSHIARVRRLLSGEAGPLSTEPGGYCLRAQRDQVDACRFEDMLASAEEIDGEGRVVVLDRALACWRANALVELADLPLFEAEARRLDALRGIARERRAKALLAVQRAATAIPDLEALLVEEPQREHARALLMDALSIEGRQTDALALYEHWRHHLIERGLEPSPELREAEVRVLLHTQRATRDCPRWFSLLPRPTSSLVGRDDDVAAVVDLLDRARIVTLVGPGGVGKTRLAIAAAARVLDRYPGGTWFCDLSGAGEPADVAAIVATTIGLSERGADPIPIQVARQLENEHTLVVLDCCERVLDSAAEVAEILSQHTAYADILATSRERLSADGEHLWPVSPLGATGPDSPAAALFADRWQAVDPTHRSGRAEPATMARICERLDGLPLAIELAAARSKDVSLPELEARLDQRLTLLVDGSRTRPRHRSLNAMIEWSYNELDERARVVFRRLGIFCGPFDLDAARTVLSGSGLDDRDLVPVVLRLVDCSLVNRSHSPAGSVYSMLDTLKEFGLEHMGQTGELEETSKAHAAWAVDFCESASNGLAGHDEEAWAVRVYDSFDDVRAALDWLVANDDDAACRVVAALHFFALWRGECEIFRWAERAANAARDRSSQWLPAAFAAAGTGAWQRGELAAARHAAQAGLARSREMDDSLSRRPLDVMGDLALLEGDLPEAVRCYRRARHLALECGDLSQAVWDDGSSALAHAYGGQTELAIPAAQQALRTARESGSPSALAYAHFALGEVEMEARPEIAGRHLDEARSQASTVGSRYVLALVDLSLASLSGRTRDVQSALRHYESVLTLWLRSGSWTGQWVTLRSLVTLLASTGASCDAALLHGAATHPARGPEPYGADARRLARAEVRLTDELGPSLFAELAERGRRLSKDQLGEEALRAVRSAAARTGA